MDEPSDVLAIIKMMLLFGSVVGGPLALITVCLTLLFHLVGGPSAESRCLDAGRGWAIAGHHQEYQFDAALKMSTLQTVTDYGCFEVRREAEGR